MSGPVPTTVPSVASLVGYAVGSLVGRRRFAPPVLPGGSDGSISPWAPQPAAVPEVCSLADELPLPKR
jgi:hypothetical protein